MIAHPVPSNHDWASAIIQKNKDIIEAKNALLYHDEREQYRKILQPMTIEQLKQDQYHRNELSRIANDVNLRRMP